MTQISSNDFKIIINERHQMTKIPTSLKYYFVTSLVLFGYDYGFIMSIKKWLQGVVKCFVFFETIFYIFTFMGTTFICYTQIIAWTLLIEYLLNTLVLKCTKYKTYDFIVEMNKHTEIFYKDRCFFYLITFINHIIVFVTKVSILISVRLFNSFTLLGDYDQIFPWAYYIANIIPCLGVDTIAINQTITFYYLYMFVRNLKDQIKTSEVDINRAAQRYVNLADIYDKVGPLQSRLVSNKNAYLRVHVQFTVAKVTR